MVDFRRLVILDNLAPLVVAAAIILVISLAGWFYGFDVSYSIYSAALFIQPLLLILLMLTFILWTLFRERPAQPVRFMYSKFKGEWQVLPRVARGVPILLLLPVFVAVFTSYKSAIGRVVPFYFDPYAIYIDQLLHGGDAWIVYSAFARIPLVTFVLNFLYKMWFFVTYLVLTFCVFAVGDTRVRSRYLVAFLLCWFLVGVVAATALSSVGPCYYEHFYRDGSFNYIFDYLRAASLQYPVPALSTQKYLLDAYTSAQPGLGSGISAAPSMHVSIATLNALFLSCYGRLAAITSWGYCMIVLIASVHLGWHYAIDGYLAMLMTYVIWKASNWIADLHIKAQASFGRREGRQTSVMQTGPLT